MKTDFYSSWNYLKEHKIFETVKGLQDFRFDILVIKVNPETEEIDSRKSRNTVTRVWLESGPYDKKTKSFTHDIRLDCGARTFEGAVVKLARLVKKYYE